MSPDFQQLVRSNIFRVKDAEAFGDLVIEMRGFFIPEDNGKVSFLFQRPFSTYLDAYGNEKDMQKEIQRHLLLGERVVVTSAGLVDKDDKLLCTVLIFDDQETLKTISLATCAEWWLTENP